MGKLRLASALAMLVAGGTFVLVACGSSSSGDDDGISPGNDASSGSDAPTTTGDGSIVLADGGFNFPTPIKHVIVIVKENHTYDNFFGEFDGGPDDPQFETAKLSNGTTIMRPHCPSTGIDRDFPHDHNSAVQAYNDGGMNGLDLNSGTTHASGQADDYEAYCMFGPVNQLGFYWQLRQNFATANHFYANMLAPSFPGHLASAIGKSPAYSNPGCPADAESCESTTDSWGCTDAPGTVVDNYDIDTCEIKPPVFPCFDMPTWMDLFPSQLTWAAYGKRRLGSTTVNPQSLDDAGAPLVLSSFNAVKAHSSAAERIAHFHEEAEIVPQIIYTNKGPTTGATLPGLLSDLPNVMFWTDASSNSEHPPGAGSPPVTPECGEQDDYDIVNAVMTGVHWQDTVILITMDDWGGFYDHVAPPVERCANGAFFNPGFRLPLMIVSAYAKPAFILTDHTEQASIPRLIEEIFGLPLTSVRDPQNRDGKAGSLLGAFDFTQPPRAPVTLTRPVNATCTNPTAPPTDAGM